MIINRARFKKALKKAGIKQWELADIIETSSQTVSRYSQGVRVPRSDAIQKIAEALGICSDYLYGTDDNLGKEFQRFLNTVGMLKDGWTEEQKQKLVNELTGGSAK